MEKNKKQILFLGDIHGNFEYVKWYTKAHKIKDCVIYQVGDFGIGFTSEFNDMNTLGNLNKFLVEHNIQMYAIRGNHDNPAFFDGHLANHFTNLHLLQDYTVIDIDGTKILGVGGAVSVDRVPRLRQMREAAKYGRDIELHWDDEVFVLDEEKLKTFENIDIVVTHTAPDFCAPDNKNGFGYLVGQFAQDDPKLYDDLREERTLLTKMYNTLKEKNKNFLYFYGHFHNTWYWYDDIGGCRFKLLGINEFYDPKIGYVDYLNEKYDE